jgi:hypothetical protein
MTTTVITGRDVSLTIATVSHDPQTTGAELTIVKDIQRYETIDGTVYKSIDDTATFKLDMLSDWGAVGSLCEALATAAKDAPNTVLAVTLTAATGSVWAFNILPVYPPVGGSGKEAQKVSLSFTVVGTPVPAFT